MARQKGIITLVGTLGGINFYVDKINTKKGNEAPARIKGGGFTSERIKNDPKMKRVLENSSEFGHCSALLKAFRRGLEGFFPEHHFKYLHRRLMTLFSALKKLDTVHRRGERRVGEGLQDPYGKHLLHTHTFTPQCDVYTVLPFDIQYDPESFCTQITQMDVGVIPFPSGATHVQLRYGILEFDFDSTAWVRHIAAPIQLSREDTVSSLQLTPTTLPQGIGEPLAVLGVDFLQEINGTFYTLRSEQSAGFCLLPCQ
ncbi:hypothetical protein [Altibacter sp.]|uniref:hypothetical protein n=1 Tax=Altibacter sp. TaxID=2024823 RepID=UPI000C8E4258|nr:hypothetical protein [Altibacter sp.]MAP55575.1 hypothetical protein [Altibacter sp.]